MDAKARTYSLGIAHILANPISVIVFQWSQCPGKNITFFM
jgi:hypothetical protein